LRGWRNRIRNASAGKGQPIKPRAINIAILLLTLGYGRAPTVEPRPHRPDQANQAARRPRNRP
jgi:hypothetical protein